MWHYLLTASHSKDTITRCEEHESIPRYKPFIQRLLLNVERTVCMCICVWREAAAAGLHWLIKLSFTRLFNTSTKTWHPLVSTLRAIVHATLYSSSLHMIGRHISLSDASSPSTINCCIAEQCGPDIHIILYQWVASSAEDSQQWGQLNDERTYILVPFRDWLHCRHTGHISCIQVVALMSMLSIMDLYLAKRLSVQGIIWIPEEIIKLITERISQTWRNCRLHSSLSSHKIFACIYVQLLYERK